MSETQVRRQGTLWFSADTIKENIDQLKHRRACGGEIEDGHLAELVEMATRLKAITNRYATRA